MPLTLRKTGNAAVDAHNERQHLRFRCMCDSRIPNHIAILPLTFAGRLKGGDEVVGYDGPCHIGTQHSRTFRMVPHKGSNEDREIVGYEAVISPAAFREEVV